VLLRMKTHHLPWRQRSTFSEECRALGIQGGEDACGEDARWCQSSSADVASDCYRAAHFSRIHRFRVPRPRSTCRMAAYPGKQPETGDERDVRFLAQPRDPLAGCSPVNTGS